MSVEIMSLVFNADLQTAGRNGVMLAIADHCDGNGKNSYQSKQTLAQKSNLNPRQVQRIVTQLVEEGLLIVEGKEACRGGYTINYSINLEALSDLSWKAKRGHDATQPILNPS